MIKLMAMVKRKLVNCNFEQDVSYFMTFSWKLEIVLHLYSYWLGRNVFGWNIVRVLKLLLAITTTNGRFLKVLQVSKEKIIPFSWLLLSACINIILVKNSWKLSRKNQIQRLEEENDLPLGKNDLIKTWTYIFIIFLMY